MGCFILSANLQVRTFVVDNQLLQIMTEYAYIIQQVKKHHFTEWDDEELRKCVDMLSALSRQELLSLYRSPWLRNEKTLKEAISNQMFKERIEERDKRLKAMSVDELIEKFHDENGYGKFSVMEMKERYDSLEKDDKLKILDTLSKSTKSNQKWTETRRKRLNKEQSLNTKENEKN